MMKSHTVTILIAIIVMTVSAGTSVAEKASGLNLELFNAAENGDLAKVKLLTEKGADVNARTTGDVEGGTALMNASGMGHLDVVKFLVEKGADVNAVATGDVEGGSATVLIIAADGGHLDVVKLLIENGADVNAANKEGKTAQYYAIRSVKTEVSDYTKTLLKYNPFTCKSYAEY